MAKKPTATTATANNSLVKTLARKKAQLAKHVKVHPNDLQSAANFVGSPRKNPHTRGNFAAKVVRLFDDVTGQPLRAFPSFSVPYTPKK